MSKNYSGRDYEVRVGTTAPTNAFDRSDGNYTKVAKIRASAVNRPRGSIDISSKDDGDNSNFVSGRRNQTFTFGGVFDHTDDAGYAVLDTAYNASNGTVYVLFDTGTAGDLAFHGTCVIEDLSIDASDESASTFSCTVRVAGALTETTLT